MLNSFVYSGAVFETVDACSGSRLCSFRKSKLVADRLRTFFHFMNLAISMFGTFFGQKKVPKKKGGGLQATPDISEPKAVLCSAVTTTLSETGYSLVEKQMSKKNGGGLQAPPEIETAWHGHGTAETFDKILKEHAELVEISVLMTCSTAVKDSVSRRPNTSKPGITAQTFCMHWMRAITVLLFGLNWEDLATSRVAFEDTAPSQKLVTEERYTTRSLAKEYRPSTTAREAKWLQWAKTREDFFGKSVEAWDETWAFHFIFDSQACKTQTDFWQLLSNGKHFQFGMGVRAIPGAWKRRLRQKQRNAATNKQFKTRAVVVDDVWFPQSLRGVEATGPKP